VEGFFCCGVEKRGSGLFQGFLLHWPSARHCTKGLRVKKVFSCRATLRRATPWKTTFRDYVTAFKIMLEWHFSV
jgi:hypothetical protein